MERVANKNFEVSAGTPVVIPTPGATRHDVIASGADLIVKAITSRGETGNLGTVTAGDCGSFDFGCDHLQVSVAAGTATGEIRSYDV